MSAQERRMAAEAVTPFVLRDLEIIQGIQRGLADMQAGRVVPHDEVAAEVHALIHVAKQARRG
jgi:predicted transcriptional regulator